MRRHLPLALIGLMTVCGCVTPKGETSADKRAYVLRMRDETLSQLYAKKPGMEHRIRNAPGYGVFSTIGTAVLFVESGHGYGVVVDNETERETYMKMVSLGVGLGLGVRDFRAVFVFNERKALRRFVNEGWEFGVGGEAAFKSGDAGAAASGEASTGPIDIYQITEAGIALGVGLEGTKFIIDDELN